MGKLTINNLGPLKECIVEERKFSVLTGAQASGKSTVAKAFFFFRTVKDGILDLIVHRSTISDGGMSLYKAVGNSLRSRFLQVFGTSRALDPNLYLRYDYSESTFISIRLTNLKNQHYYSPNYVWVEFSEDIKSFFHEHNFIDNFDASVKDSLSHKLAVLFCDKYETLFIPAGRSLITLLTAQLNYIFTAMSEDQKRSMDYCTQKYVELILKIRPSFSDGIEGFLESKLETAISPVNESVCRKAMGIIDRVLKGKYAFANGEEQLRIDDSGKYVKINFTSSGQQEAVWLFNILMYQLITGRKTFLIVEEPEAHLYPDAQKAITELLALFANAGNSVLITTHSPYILGAVNNLLYADKVSAERGEKKVVSIVPRSIMLDDCEAFFAEGGRIRGCMGPDRLIENEVIDGASKDINNVYGRLAEIYWGEEG